MGVTDNPFQDQSPSDIYDLLTDLDNELPVWPSEDIQAGYTATSGPAAVRRTQSFIDMLDEHGAFTPGWKGLDYGAGWGRIASLLLAKGSPEQLDLVDAWDGAMNYLEAGGFKNHRWKVSEILQPGELPDKTYNFVYAFSVFTHLAPKAFWNNLEVLAGSVRDSLYITVRLPEFADHLVKHRYPDRAAEMREALEREGHWYMPTASDMSKEAVFGTMIVTKEYLEHGTAHLGSLDYLGQPEGQMQHVSL